MEPEVRQVLLDMKAQLSKGWVKKQYGTKKGGTCIVGSLAALNRLSLRKNKFMLDRSTPQFQNRDTDDNPEEYSYYILGDSPEAEALRLLAVKAGVGYYDLPVWQDAPERTHEDVIGLIDDVLAADPVVDRPFPTSTTKPVKIKR